jgi:localization factor PodJL
VSAISPKSTAGSFNLSVLEAPDQASREGQGATPAGGWQQAAGIFSAIANMLSSDLTTQEMDRQKRADLIQKLDELETTLRNGGSDDNDSLKAALARLEAELRAWRGKPQESEVSGQQPVQDTGGQWAGGGILPQVEGTLSNAHVIASDQDRPSHTGPFETAWEGIDSDFTGAGRLDWGGRKSVHGAEEGEGAGVTGEAQVPDAGASAKTNPSGDSMGSLEQFDRLARDLQVSLAQNGSKNAQRPLIERWEAANRVSETFPAPRIEHGYFDELTKRIETSHRQLAERLETGLAAVANETNTLKDMISSAAKKIELVREADQSQQAGATLERGIANLAGHLDRAGDGCASLTSLEHGINGLSVQLEETRRIASGLSNAAAAGPLADLMKATSEHGDDAKQFLREITDLRTLHEDTWQRANLVLTEIQQSIDQIAKVTRGGAGLHNSGLVPSSLDPFAPILTSLAHHSQDGSLAAKVIRMGVGDPGASDKEILLAGEAFAADRVQVAGKLRAGDAANGDTKDGGRDDGAAGFLIEPGHGFPGRGEEYESRGQSSAPPKATHDREEGTSRTDFIAAARRAARTAQKELHGSEAKSAIGNDGIAEQGLFVRYKWPLVVGGVLLFAAMGAYAMARTLTHNHFGDFVPEFLKQFDRGAIRAKPADAGEASGNKIFASQSLPRNTPPTQTQASQLPARQSQAGGSLRGQVAATMAAVPLDPIAPADPGFSANGAVRSGYLMAGNSNPAARVIAGSDAIVAATLGRNTMASSSSRPRPPAVMVPANALLETAVPVALAAGASAVKAARAVAEPVKNLLEEAKSGDAVAQFDLAVRYAEGDAAERNYELAAQWYGKAAEQGLAVAEYRLASLYEKGLGVSQDTQRAKNLYQRAAEKGNTRAMHNLGVLAVEGNDGKPNYTSAALWFGKAAEYGIRDSQYNVAVLLARGLGLPKDLVKSYTWFAIVAAAGDADAAKKRDEVAARLTSSELAAANAAAAAFEPRQIQSAANEAPPPAAHPEVAPATQTQPAKPKVSGL